MPTTSDTTTATGATRPAQDRVKGAMQAGFIFFVCWGGAISYWRTTRSAPGTGELALYLLGLPLLLVLGLFIGRKLAGQRTAMPAAPAASAPAREAPAAPAHAASLAILATALRSAHGVSAEELGAAVAAGKARADLDPELVDDEGFPVMSARSPDARDAALQDEIAQWLARNGMPDLHFSDEQWRALVLGTAVLEELAGHAASRLLPGEDEPAMLRLVPLLPADWSPAQRSAAGIWFEHTAARCGWPLEHITLNALAPLDTNTVPPAATPAAVLDRLARDAATTDARVTALVVACASCIGDETIARWSADGILFTSTRPQGRIPGEGAAGLLLADLPQVRTLADTRFALLEPVQEARRETSVDDTRRADAAALADAAQRTLAGHREAGTEVVKIVADTGHRSNRVLELMAFMAGSMPQLDEVDDLLRVGEACGECAAVSFMAALAVASQYALDQDAAVLCVGSEDAYRRCVTLIHPGQLGA